MNSFVVGFLVAIAGGLIGLGGAELRLPFLIGVLGLAAHAAVPVNLAVSLVTVLAALPFRLGGIDADALTEWWAVAAALTIGAMAAAYIGASWLRSIDGRLLSRVIGALLALLGIVMVAEAIFPLAAAGLLVGASAAAGAAAGLALGAVIGTISSLLGVAGGEVIIPTLMLGYGVPIAAAGTLSLMISLPTLLVGMARHARLRAFSDQRIVRGVIAPMAAGALLGAPIGGALAAYVPGDPIKAALGVLLIWSAWKVGAKHE